MKELEKLLGYNFEDRSLLNVALTHSTYSNEYGGQSNERLEFLGDSVLELVVREYLFLHYESEEGKLTEWKKQIVDKKYLKSVAEKLGLAKYLKLGGSLQNQPLSDKLVSNIFESIVGAIYLDGGLDAARDFILKVINIDSRIKFLGEHNLDYITTLQELVQKEHISLPIYEDREKVDGLFVKAVVIDGKAIAEGRGTSKQEASKEAAKIAINIIKGRK